MLKHFFRIHNINSKMYHQQTFSICELFGFCALLYLFVYKPIKLWFFWFKNRYSNEYLKILKPGKDFYAVITGSTDGIGLEYARQLAEKGYSLVLLSRTEEKLKKVSRKIQEEFPQCKKVETLAVDFSRTDIYDRIKQKLESIDGQIHVLVNNVAASYHLPEYFTDYPEGFHLELINTNIVSVTEMSRIVLKIMLKQKYDPKVNPVRGVLINISSFLGLIESPMGSIYSSSKAYMNFLSKILSYELDQHKILVQTVTPHQVATNMTTDMYDPLFSVKADAFVREALKTVGTEATTSGHPWHKFHVNVSLLAREFLGESLFMKLMFGYAKSALRVYRDKKCK